MQDTHDITVTPNPEGQRSSGIREERSELHGFFWFIFLFAAYLFFQAVFFPNRGTASS